MTLPTAIPSFALDLPWPVDFGGGSVQTVSVRCAREQWRTYGDMEVAEYLDDGPLVAHFAIAVNHYSFVDQDPADLVRSLLFLSSAVARYQAVVAVGAAAPGGYIAPPCCGWPCTAEVAAHLDTGVGTPPAPRGTAAAFRVLPASAYATTTITLAAYRGTPVPD
jgi:hypothetical protein